MNYYAITDAPTPFNITNHTYWNLSGDLKRKITTHKLKLACSSYLPVRDDLIPLGEILTVQNTIFDLTSSTLLQDRLHLVDGGGEPGYDHCFVIDPMTNTHNTDTYSSSLKFVGELWDEESGRKLTLFSTQPGVQVYTGNFLSKDLNDFPHVQHNAICLETQHFPDSVNQPSFPNVILRPNEVYSHQAVFAFSIA